MYALLQMGSAVAVEAVSPSPSVVPPLALVTPAPPLSPDEQKKLRVEFKAALRQEELAFDHQEKSALKEFSIAQAAKVKEWRSREKKERHQFFDTHSTGPEQRKYVLDFVGRKKEFDLQLGESLKSEKRSWREKREALRVFQKNRQMKFEETLNQGQRPSADLWKSQ
jgi:hypothetical protein